MKKQILLFLYFLLLSCTFLEAQKLDLEELKGIKIRNIGPAGMSGRVTAIDVDLTDPDHIYIGTASGGVWESKSGGINWKPIFDKQNIQSIGSLYINQKNPAEIWVGTGEGNPRNSHNSGNGIYKSIDGGKTWKRMGLENTRLIHRIVVHHHNSDIVYVAALGSAWGANEERGIYKTIDGGKTWKKILYINDQTGAADFVVDPNNPNKILAAMWEYGRKPWTFNSGGKGSSLHLSYDGGETWKKLNDEDGLPKGELGRIGLAISPSKPNIIYALIEAKKNGLYKSTDGGLKWLKISDKDIGNRPFYYADIFVDPKNENRIYNLWSYVSKSEDGGKTFKTILNYGNNIHPDHHAFWIHPEDPNYLIDGNDGGLNISRDGGKNWQFITNLPLAQFYHIDYDMDIPYNVCGGMQDNGSWVGPSSIWKSGGIRNADWQEVLFGDGFDVLLRKEDNRYGFAMWQGGNLNYFDRETGQSKNVKPIHPDDIHLRFAWNAALAENPHRPCSIYFGSQFVHKSMDCGNSWEIISPDLTTNDTTKQLQNKSGGLTLDVTGAESYTTIVAIAPSPVDEEVIWVGTDDGNVQITKNGGEHWENVASQMPDFPKGSWIPQIEVSKRNAGEAFIVVNNYRRNDWDTYIYHTKDFGKNFTRIADGKKVEGYALSIVQDPVESDLLFLGTDQGLYITFDGGGNWNKWTNDFPPVPVRDLKIHPREHDLIIGTFGRAAWILDNIQPLREIAATKATCLEKDFVVFDVSPSYLSYRRSVHGTRFIAQGTFEGRNKSSIPKITLWVKKKKDEKQKDPKEVKNKKVKKTKTDKKEITKDEKKNEKVKVQVFNMDGDTIRTFTKKLEEGMNRITWQLRKNGVRWPSHSNPKPDDDEPRGSRVKPGIYKMVFTYKEFKDSTTIDVQPDHRLDISLKDLVEKEKTFDAFSKQIELATKSFDRLKEAEKTIKLVNDQMLHAPDSLKKEIRELGKTLQDSISILKKLYTLPKDIKGIHDGSHTLNSKMWNAYSRINNSDGVPNQMAKIAITKAEKAIDITINKINTFFKNDWKVYQNKIESTEHSLFKEYLPLKLE